MVIDYGNFIAPLDSELAKMGGRSTQNPQKKPNFGGNTHVTLNLKPCKPGFAVWALGMSIVVMHLIHLVCDLMCDFFLVLTFFFCAFIFFFPCFWMLIFLFSLFPAFRFAFLSHIFSPFSPPSIPSFLQPSSFGFMSPFLVFFIDFIAIF
jgi:hypothetical protein